jgi:hypothetical protein
MLIMRRAQSGRKIAFSLAMLTHGGGTYSGSCSRDDGGLFSGAEKSFCAAAEIRLLRSPVDRVRLPHRDLLIIFQADLLQT